MHSAHGAVNWMPHYTLPTLQEQTSSI